MSKKLSKDIRKLMSEQFVNIPAVGTGPLDGAQRLKTLAEYKQEYEEKEEEKEEIDEVEIEPIVEPIEEIPIDNDLGDSLGSEMEDEGDFSTINIQKIRTTLDTHISKYIDSIDETDTYKFSNMTDEELLKDFVGFFI